jgi:hypothetical protein
MEVSTIMTSSVQMQQVLSEITPDNEAGNPQSNQQQSIRFSELFDQCAGTGNGVWKTKDLSAAIVLSKAIAPSMQASRQLSGEQDSGSGVIPPEFAAGFLPATSPGERSLPETMAALEPEDNSAGCTQALDANQPLMAPALTVFSWAPPFVPCNTSMKVDAAQPLPELRAMKFSPAEVTITEVISEGTEAKGEAPALRAQISGLERKQASLQPGNPGKTAQGAAIPVSSLLTGMSGQEQGQVSGQPGNPEKTAQEAAIPVSSLLTGMSGQEQGQVSGQPGNPEKTAQGAVLPAPAGKFLLQERQVRVEQQAEPSIITPEPLVKVASEVTAGPDLTRSAALSGPGVSVTTLESGIPPRPSLFRETSLYRAINSGAESNPEGDSVIQGKSLQPERDVVVPQSEVISRPAMKPGTNLTIPQPEAVSRPGAEIPLLTVQGEYADGLEVPGLKTVADQSPAQETPLPGENRRGGETAVNAYRTVTAEALIQGKKGAAMLHGDIRPSTPAAIAEVDVANAGEATHLIDIVFAENGKALTKGAGGEAAGKAEEVKSAGIESPTAFVQGQGELRTNGESRPVSPANDAKTPSPGHIHQQVREKLESGDYGVNKGNITLKLHPEELGELKIKLRMEDQRLKIEIVTENPSVKEVLMQNLDTLKDTLSRQNIAMERFNVSTDLRQGFQQGGRDERQLMQGERGSNAAFQPAKADDEPALQKFHYGWDNDNSLVSLVL